MDDLTNSPDASARLTFVRRWWTYGIGLGLWLSGAAWLVLHYFMQRETAFGPAPHPLEHWSLALHGLFAFASLWLFGLLWGVHIVKAWRTRRHRISGITLTALLLWLVASGYLLYYLGSDEAISVVALIHWGVGLALPIPFILHRFARIIGRSETSQLDDMDLSG